MEKKAGSVRAWWRAYWPSIGLIGERHLPVLMVIFHMVRCSISLGNTESPATVGPGQGGALAGGSPTTGGVSVTPGGDVGGAGASGRQPLCGCPTAGACHVNESGNIGKLAPPWLDLPPDCGALRKSDIGSFLRRECNDGVASYSWQEGGENLRVCASTGPWSLHQSQGKLRWYVKVHRPQYQRDNSPNSPVARASFVKIAATHQGLYLDRGPAHDRHRPTTRGTNYLCPLQPSLWVLKRALHYDPWYVVRKSSHDHDEQRLVQLGFTTEEDYGGAAKSAMQHRGAPK